MNYQKEIIDLKNRLEKLEKDNIRIREVLGKSLKMLDPISARYIMNLMKSNI